MLKNKPNNWKKFLLSLIVVLSVVITYSITVTPAMAARQMENLNRGLIAIQRSDGVYLSWRMLGTDPSDIGFNIYRNGTRINTNVVTNRTNFLDTGGNSSCTYYIKPVINGTEGTASETVGVWTTNYLTVPLQRPSTSPLGATYSANDCSIADLDGDKEYEIVVKWEPSDAKDPSQDGYTSNVYLDGYELNGTRKWRIDLGINIRAGAHYTQFIVYDFDGDGKAEIACKTADGTKDGTGTIIGDGSKDWRNSAGRILDGPEYLTIFRGTDGKALVTTNYIPPRGTVSSWGDSYGNRVDRFLGGVAYVDGQRPTLIMCRGYYTKTYIVAWNYRNGSLTKVWQFDTGEMNDGYRDNYEGQGNHNLSVGDVDGDGKDEIIYGAMAVNDDGSPMYTTGLGHGDAMHLADIIPSRSGLEVWQCHENTSTGAGASLRDARTGTILLRVTTSSDCGRALAADIDANYPGMEIWAASTVGLYSSNGTKISSTTPPINFAVWWDGDLLRELLDNIYIYKWNPSSNSTTTLLTASGCASNNGTKATPCLTADVFGDWREEVIWRTSDDTALRIYTTTYQSDTKIYTLMHDPQYRISIAWQNVGYNQPPHTSFFIGNGMSTPPTPNIYLVP
jgi:rhamnogalacturonan endolyase